MKTVYVITCNNGQERIQKILMGGCKFQLNLMLTKYDRPVGVVGKNITIGTGDLGFDSWSNRTLSPTVGLRDDVFVLLRHYAAEMGPATRYKLLRNTFTSVMKI